MFEPVLKRIEDDGEIQGITSVLGGDINESFYVRTKENEYFVKRNRAASRSFFEFEANGLRQIQETNTIDVPRVYGIFEDEKEGFAMLWLEWVEGEKTNRTDELLGERLAAMHLSKGEGFGFEGKGYIGRLPIESKVMDSWLEYYRTVCLLGQLKLGQAAGTIRGKREKLLHKLIERLDEWIPKKPKPSLLHGDLWGGNWITGKDGDPYVIDPSVLRGDHEFEIAFTRLFGGFSERFYEAYQSVFPLSDEYKIKEELYQLYYLLVHLNMFGESYGSSVDRILKKYVG